MFSSDTDPLSDADLRQLDFDVTIGQCVVFERNLACGVLIRHTTLFDGTECLLPYVSSRCLQPNTCIGALRNGWIMQESTQWFSLRHGDNRRSWQSWRQNLYIDLNRKQTEKGEKIIILWCLQLSFAKPVNASFSFLRSYKHANICSLSSSCFLFVYFFLYFLLLLSFPPYFLFKIFFFFLIVSVVCFPPKGICQTFFPLNKQTNKQTTTPTKKQLRSRFLNTSCIFSHLTSATLTLCSNPFFSTM